MSSILKPFTLIGKATRAFFKADVRLRRGEHGLEVVLDESTLPPRGAAPGAKVRKQPDPTAERDRKALSQVQASLARLLDELPENRAALRHLAFIEHALAKKGLRALHKVPYDVLKRALDQFEGVVVNWSDEGLATLRSKMAVALIEREPESAAPAPVDAPVSVPDTAPLALPVDLEGEDAAEAEAALMAAYGAMALPGLDLAPAADDGDGPALEVQGELNSPSGKALAKAARRGETLPSADARQREHQV